PAAARGRGAPRARRGRSCYRRFTAHLERPRLPLRPSLNHPSGNGVRGNDRWNRRVIDAARRPTTQLRGPTRFGCRQQRSRRVWPVKGGGGSPGPASVAVATPVLVVSIYTRRVPQQLEGANDPAPLRPLV